MSKNTSEKFSITLTPELASYLKMMAERLKAPISKVIAFALTSQKQRELNARRREKLIRSYKQIAENYSHGDFREFEKVQWELSKKLD